MKNKKQNVLIKNQDCEKRKSKTLRDLPKIEIYYVEDPLNSEAREAEILEILFQIFIRDNCSRKSLKTN